MLRIRKLFALAATIACLTPTVVVAQTPIKMATSTRFPAPSAHWARIWDLEVGKVIWFSQEFPGHRAQFAFSPGGTQFVAGSHDHGAKVWDATTGTVIRSIGI